ncbi:MAG: diguanylate cyclase [Halofilum sp. (in: g-proteobacteria)]|nr:diguanylate cyclase [Halofilum sp. (in: g-proteobacteria)]
MRAGASGYVAAPSPEATLVAVAERALASRDLEHENTRLRSRLAAIDSCSRLLRCLDPATVYAVALDLLLGGTGRERGLAHFRRPSLPGSDGVVFRGFSRDETRAVRHELAEAEPVRHQLAGRPRVLADGPVHRTLRGHGIPEPGAALAMPLSGEEREAGMLYVFDGGDPFTELEIERAGVIAEHGQLALDNAERYQGAKARALIDDATGLHNIRYLLDSADHELERASRYGLELSVLFIDIDRFKRVNDAHGHLTGTGTLRHVAQRLQDCVRQIDTLARYGGDEFTALLTDTSPQAALTAAERIRATVAGSPFDDGQGNSVAVTVSIGVACYPHDSRQRDDLVDLADKAMYRAKSLGRDRVALARDCGGREGSTD